VCWGPGEVIDACSLALTARHCTEKCEMLSISKSNAILAHLNHMAVQVTIRIAACLGTNVLPQHEHISPLIQD
jgi:hypothetical protein